MGQPEKKRVGVIVGRERDWSDAFIKAINEGSDDVEADLVRLGGTFMDEECPYDVIVDRASHEVPYYRLYVEFAKMQGCYLINNPYIWSSDSKFFGTAVARRLGYNSPKTVALPNKDIEAEVGPGTFRNLVYPMDWRGIIDYVGVPAIFKEVRSGGRPFTHRVHNVDELIQRYDESGTRTMILQQIIESDSQLHCLVVGQEKVLPLRFLAAEGRYEPGVLDASDAVIGAAIESARAISAAYGYDLNLVELVESGSELLIINSTNPAPVMDSELFSQPQFEWCVTEMAAVAVDRARKPIPQRLALD